MDVIAAQRDSPLLRLLHIRLKSSLFWRTVCKTVRPMLSDRCPACLSVCPVCNLGVLWPNGWMHQYETRHGGRPRTRPHCVRWGPSSPQKRHSPPFLAHVFCGQMAGCIREVGLITVDMVLHGDPAHPQKRGHSSPPTFQPMSIVAKRLDESRYHWVWR